MSATVAPRRICSALISSSGRSSLSRSGRLKNGAFSVAGAISRSDGPGAERPQRAPRAQVGDQGINLCRRERRGGGMRATGLMTAARSFSGVRSNPIQAQVARGSAAGVADSVAREALPLAFEQPAAGVRLRRRQVAAPAPPTERARKRPRSREHHGDTLSLDRFEANGYKTALCPYFFEGRWPRSARQPA